jgi:hypothetical protein
MTDIIKKSSEDNIAGEFGKGFSAGQMYLTCIIQSNRAKASFRELSSLDKEEYPNGVRGRWLEREESNHLPARTSPYSSLSKEESLAKVPFVRLRINETISEPLAERKEYEYAG